MYINKAAKWKILFITTASTSLVFLDNTIMPVAIPTIANELHLSEIGGLWIINSYLLALLALLFVGGKLVDFFGQRKITLWGYSLFAIASIGGASSFSQGLLIVSRALQGFGGALILPATGSLLLSHFPLNERARALGINTGISSIFLIAGPIVGGFLTTCLCWRWIFGVNLPLLVFGFIMIVKLLPKHVLTQKEPFHFLKTLPLVSGIVFLVIALMEGSFHGWNSFLILSFFAVSALFFLIFLWQTLAKKETLIDFFLLRKPSFYTSLFCIFITQLTVVMLVLWAIYFQTVLAFSPFETGLLILMAVSPVICIAPLSGVIADKMGAKLPICCGFIFLLFSFIWMQKTTHSLFPGLIAFGCGIPLIYSPAYANAMAEVSNDHLGGATSLITMTRQLAATLGLAIMTAIFHSVYLSTHSYSKAFNSILFFGITLSLLGFMMALLIVTPKKNRR